MDMLFLFLLVFFAIVGVFRVLGIVHTFVVKEIIKLTKKEDVKIWMKT